jgi:hypothetical protein
LIQKETKQQLKPGFGSDKRCEQFDGIQLSFYGFAAVSPIVLLKKEWLRFTGWLKVNSK